ncbi:MAG: metallophosphoesterase [Bacteroidota bacterium]|nr:metallophosphoesterase [Bacteroidota bacterium]
MNIPDSKQPDQPLFSFGLIADIQYCECKNYGSRFFNNSLTKLNKAVKGLNDSDAEFIFTLGDLIEKNYKSFDPVLKILEKSDKKVYHVLGNHDYEVKNRYKKKVEYLLTGEKSYYSFTSRAYRFIALNTCEISTYSGSMLATIKASNIIDRLKRENLPYAFEWNGTMSKKQIEWFKSELIEARKKNEYVFVFSHHTIEPLGTHNMYNRKEILDIVSGFDNIIAWFSGHEHSGGYGNYNNIHFVTLKGMVETPDSNAWALVEIYDNKLMIKGKDRQESYILTY